MAYVDFKDLQRRVASDKILRDKAFSIATNPKYDRYQVGIASMIYKSLDKKTYATSANKFAVVLLKVKLCQNIILWT